MVNALIRDYRGTVDNNDTKTDAEEDVVELKPVEDMTLDTRSAVNDNFVIDGGSLYYPVYIHPRDYDGIRIKNNRKKYGYRV